MLTNTFYIRRRPCTDVWTLTVSAMRMSNQLDAWISTGVPPGPAWLWPGPQLFSKQVLICFAADKDLPPCLSPKLDDDGRSSGNFVKNFRNGGVSLKLTGQDNNVVLPEYGRAVSVQGMVEILKGESVQSVKVKVSGDVILFTHY
jgi:hypothetical protein